MTYLDVRPAGLDLAFRPGTTVPLSLEWPAGYLTGRTFTSTLDGVALAVDVAGDVLTVEATDAQTADITDPVPWLLLEDVDGTAEPVMVGTWTPSSRASASAQGAVRVTVGAAAVTVTVQPGVSAAALAAVQADVDALPTDADVAIAVAAETSARGDAVGRRVDWYAAADWDRFTPVVVNTPDNTVLLTASAGAGIATGSASGAGSDRRLYLLDGFEATDMEVRCDWTLGGGQLGLGLRAQDGAVVVVWQNIFFGATGNSLWGVWEYDGTEAGFSTNQGAQSLDGFRSPIMSASGNGTTVTVQTRYAHGLAAGNTVHFDSSFGSFGQATVASTPTATSFTFASATSGSWTGGTWRWVIAPGRFHVAARLVGNRLTYKHWLPHEAEPTWTHADRVRTATLPATLAKSGGPPPSGPGGAAIVIAHLGSSGTVTVNDFVVRSLD